jgi:hypothetical protein
MTERDVAQQVLDAIKRAAEKPAREALVDLNGLIPLVQGAGGAQELEAEEARSSAFLAICEVGKALHRGQPADGLYEAAIKATERWMAAAK